MKINKELEEAVLLGNLSLTKSLIKGGCDVDGKDRYGRTIIYDAITKGFQDIVLELCLAHTDINNQDKDGKTPLHFSVIHSQLEIAKILIQYGANVNLKDSNGNTPIFDAVFNTNGINTIILLLMENGADPSLENNYGISPKDIAETSDNFKFPHIFK
jgi:uncharacterized protein